MQPPSKRASAEITRLTASPQQATSTVPGTPTATPAAAERHAVLTATAALSGGRPVLANRYHTAPLKIAKAFELSDGDWRQLAVIQMDVSPGLMAGDRYALDWTAEEDTRLFVTNQAYARVHPCGDGEARQRQTFRLAPGALIEYMPEPVMLYRDAALRMETAIELSPGSVMLMGEVFSPGRIARGEAFDFRLYDARLTVSSGGGLVHYQRQRWEPASMAITAPGCFGPFTHIGAFSIWTDRVTPALADRLREALSAADLPEDIQWGVARTATCGIVVQAAGRSAWQMQRLVGAAWDSARRELFGQPPLRLLRDGHHA